jgi:hypothetical protein
MKLSDLNILSIGHTIQMVGVIYQGEGRTFLVPFPEEHRIHEDNEDTVVLNMDLADWQRFLQQTDLLDVEAVVRDKSGAVGKAILRKSQRQIEQGVSWRVYKRDQYRCRYCWADDVPLTVDHVVCWEEGGPSIEANLLSSCRKCNRVRGNLAYGAWLPHPHYREVSKRLPDEMKRANEALIGTLDSIPRRTQPRSR